MAIEVKNLYKSFGNTQALSDVSLRLGGDKIYGLLGNNGAGKTTLLNIITSRYLADSGQVLLDGAPAPDNDQALGQIFMLGEKRYYPDNMRVREALRLSGDFYPAFDAAYAAELAQRFRLPLKKKITALSTGYGSIFKIVLALSVNTPYLLLDEPVLGLDAQHRDIFYKTLIEKYSERPATIVISTHLIAEVAQIIEHTLIIRNGRIIKDAPCEELLGGGYSVSGPAALVDEYVQGRQVMAVNRLGGLKTACVDGPPEREALPPGLEISRLNLQDYFIQLMSEEGEQ